MSPKNHPNASLQRLNEDFYFRDLDTVSVIFLGSNPFFFSVSLYRFSLVFMSGRRKKKEISGRALYSTLRSREPAREGE
jgi:hypothetical protein